MMPKDQSKLKEEFTHDYPASLIPDLEAELKNLKSVRRPAVIEAIATAREHGDLSENAEYHAAREQQSFIEGRIMELEAVMPKFGNVSVASTCRHEEMKVLLLIGVAPAACFR